LSEDVIAATRHGWLDAAVLDARDQPMPFSVITLSAIGPPHDYLLKCAAQTETGAAHPVYRCVVPQAVENAYGVRMSSLELFGQHVPLKVAVRDQTGAALALFDGEAHMRIGGAIGGTAIPFDGPHHIETLEFEMFNAEQHVGDVRLVVPPTVLESWRPARLIQSQADGRSFTYAVNFASRIDAVRFHLEDRLPVAGVLIVNGCAKPDCAGADRSNPGEADSLALGPDSPSFPVRLPTGSHDPYLRVTSTVALAKAPDVEIAWAPLALAWVRRRRSHGTSCN
jgi:hypothetical protein